MNSQPTLTSDDGCQDLAALCAKLAADRARMHLTLLHLRNHSSVNSHQIELIDDALSGNGPAPAGWIAPTALNWAARQSEVVVKVTSAPQPEHGFTMPVFLEALPAPELAGRLRSALEKEMRRRRVVSLPRKLELMRDLGLKNIDDTESWMRQAANDFEVAAKEFLA